MTQRDSYPSDAHSATESETCEVIPGPFSASRLLQTRQWGSYVSQNMKLVIAQVIS